MIHYPSFSCIQIQGINSEISLTLLVHHLKFFLEQIPSFFGCFLIHDSRESLLGHNTLNDTQSFGIRHELLLKESINFFIAVIKL